MKILAMLVVVEVEIIIIRIPPIHAILPMEVLVSMEGKREKDLIQRDIKLKDLCMTRKQIVMPLYLHVMIELLLVLGALVI